MSTAYQQLKKYFHHIGQIDHAITFLQWDQLVMMPAGGSPSRAEALAELTSLRHQRLCASNLGELLGKAKQKQENDPERHRSLLEMERIHANALAVPADLVKAQSLAGSKCEHGWRRQRRENDWLSFLANFREVVNLARQEAQARFEASMETLETPYDALLSLYCTGDTSSDIAAVFTTLRDALPELIETIMERQRDHDLRIKGLFPLERQRILSRRLMEILGFSFDHGRLDTSGHPFSTGCRGDQRITTRFREDEFLEALLATAHETGHASYENGLPPNWDHLPIGAARNMCLHESQSLLFEKHLFLSKPFFSAFTPHIHELLPDTASYSMDDIHSACCRVQPSFIRVEADEVTYPLHVILRFEIEKALVNGALEADDIPQIWDEKMQSFLGLSTAGNYRDGCLQDIHWTDGSFGYFPSYTMGAVNSAQLFAAVKRDHGDWEERLGLGEVDFVRKWLGRNIWSKASSMDSQDIMRQATGEGTRAKYFLDHLRERYLGK